MPLTHQRHDGKPNSNRIRIVHPDRLIELIGGATMLRMLLRPDEKLDDTSVDQTTAIVVHGVRR
jgi:hypothetical protein